MPESEPQYEIENSQYLLVEEADSWEYYEEQARDYYSEILVKENFTVWYTEHTKTFVEKDGAVVISENNKILFLI